MCSVCNSYPCDKRCPNAPAPEFLYDCDYCGEGIKEGEPVYDIHGDRLHADCLYDWADAHKTTAL